MTGKLSTGIPPLLFSYKSPQSGQLTASSSDISESWGAASTTNWSSSSLSEFCDSTITFETVFPLPGLSKKK